jgi:hypothetical protein
MNDFAIKFPSSGIAIDEALNGAFSVAYEKITPLPLHLGTHGLVSRLIPMVAPSSLARRMGWSH